MSDQQTQVLHQCANEVKQVVHHMAAARVNEYRLAASAVRTLEAQIEAYKNLERECS